MVVVKPANVPSITTTLPHFAPVASIPRATGAAVFSSL